MERDTEAKKPGGGNTTLCECCQRHLDSFMPGWKFGAHDLKAKPRHESVEKLVESAASCSLCEKLLAALSSDVPTTGSRLGAIPLCTPPAPFFTSRYDKHVAINCKEVLCLEHRQGNVAV